MAAVCDSSRGAAQSPRVPAAATDRTIAELEQLLAPAGFLRISRSAIVNLNYARELVPWSSGTYKLKLSNNVELNVSRDRARILKSKVG